MAPAAGTEYCRLKRERVAQARLSASAIGLTTHPVPIRSRWLPYPGSPNALGRHRPHARPRNSGMHPTVRELRGLYLGSGNFPNLASAYRSRGGSDSRSRSYGSLWQPCRFRPPGCASITEGASSIATDAARETAVILAAMTGPSRRVAKA